MDTDERNEGSAIGRRYGQSAANEWQRVLSHFALGDGFALLVLIVPDRDGMQLCRDELERWLVGHGKHWIHWKPATPRELREVSILLLNREPEPRLGAVWIAAVVPRSAPDFPAWEAAWRRTLEGLNQQRNPLRRHFDCPLLIVGAPWIVPLFRDVAPDLWSVRSQVVRIEPERERARQRMNEAIQETARRTAPRAGAPDPALALWEAERLRDVRGRERERASMLIRAGIGLFGRNDPHRAEIILREAVNLTAATGEMTSHGIAMHGLARAILDQGRAAEAEEAFRRALALAEEGGATAVSRGTTMHELGHTILDHGRAKT